MADIVTKIRTKRSGEFTDVFVLIEHPMESGQRPDPKDNTKRIPAHYIQKLEISINDKEVASTNLGPAVASDPMLGFKIKGAKSGDKIKASWSDNKGLRGGSEAIVG